MGCVSPLALVALDMRVWPPTAGARQLYDQRCHE